MLLAITPNPALDRTLVIPGMRAGGVYRAESVLVAAGGKGLNVARAAHTLKQPLRVCAPLGGLTGQLVAHLAATEGFDCQWSWYSPGETRVCTLVVDPQGGEATALNEPGMPLTRNDWEAFVQTILAAAKDAHLITISGSLPPGVPSQELAALVRTLSAAGRHTIVDTSGAALQSVLDSCPHGIKINRDELSAALATPITDIPQAVQALTTLHTRGISLAVVSLGAQGALAVSDAGICWAYPPTLKIISSIGCGDSLLAGLATGILHGLPLAKSLRLGVACGAADALTIGGGLFTREDSEHIQSQTAVQWL